MMRMWLDDIRPKPEGYDMEYKTYHEFSAHLFIFSVYDWKISHVSFDHDLGGDKDPWGNELTGMSCAKALVRYDFEHDLLTNDFTFNVHSANPVGTENIRCYLNNYLRLKKEEECKEHKKT